MIAGSETALAALYPPDGRFALSPTALVAARTRFLVAYLDGRPVGCGGVAPCAAGGDRWAELKRIYADPALRRRGIASAIVARLEALARDTGHTVLRLETGTRSPDAIAFYARHGYTRRGPFGAYAENGSSVFMEKAL
ncbi:MAG: GNAT family N-acetyltransferase [Pseudomonadota bacterium]